MMSKLATAFEQINNREKYLIVALVITFLLLSYGILRYIPHSQEIDSLQTSVKNTEERLTRIAIPKELDTADSSLQQRKKNLQQQLATLQQQVAIAKERLVDVNTPLARQKLEQQIAAPMGRLNLKIISNTPVNVVTVGDLKLHSQASLMHPLSQKTRLVRELQRPLIKYELQGSYASLRSFITHLNQLPMRVHIADYDIAVSSEQNLIERQLLHISLVLVL